MRKISSVFLCGALTLILLTAACSGQQGSPTAAVTNAVGNLTASPAALETQTLTTGTEVPSTAAAEGTIGNLTATLTIPTATAGVPVTGADVTLLEGQFCIQNMAHALLVLPDTATYEVLTQAATLSTPGPDMGCKTVDTFNGRQIVLCRSQENTSLNLNICIDGNNCQQLLINLQSCPLSQNPSPQANLTNTPEAGAVTNTPGAIVPSDTPVGASSTTPLAIPTATP
jgi:hypothetical protein